MGALGADPGWGGSEAESGQRAGEQAGLTPRPEASSSSHHLKTGRLWKTLQLGRRLSLDADLPAASPAPLHAPLWPLCLLAWPPTREVSRLLESGLVTCFGSEAVTVWGSGPRGPWGPPMQEQASPRLEEKPSGQPAPGGGPTAPAAR